VVSERFASRWDTFAFVVCIVLALVARALPAPVQDGIATAVRSTLLAPFLTIQQQTELLRSSRMRMRLLVAERDSAAVAALRVDALEEENAQLRRLLGLHERLRGRVVAAEVLGQTTPTAGVAVVLSVGSDAGVHPLTPVVTPAGLLGVVRSAGPSRSVAVLWTHPDFRVSTMTRDGSVFGLVAPWGASGPNTMMMRLSGIPYRDVIPAGTKLYTSGFGGVYPRGIPVGEIVGVADEQEGVSRTYLVRPAVHPASAAHVILLVSPELDVTGAFEGGRP
jgi:rod shape-determining protein MreC